MTTDPTDRPPAPPVAGPATEQGVLSGRRITLITLIVALAAFMEMLDASVLVTAIPAMAKSFGASPLDLGVGITAYVMAIAILLPASGWLADRIGARRLFVSALLAFSLSSVLCGLSQTLPQFVAARVLQGLSGAVLGPVGSIILMRIIARRDLLRMMNIFSAPMLIAPVLGPPIGGLVTTWFGWSWIFFLNLPVGLAGALLAWRFIPRQAQLRRPLDTLGFVLNAVALGGLIYGFGELGAGSLSRPAAVAVIAAGLGFGVAAVRHARRTPHPLFSLRAAGNATFRLTSIVALPFMRLPITTLPFVLPIMLQVGFGMTALASGMLFLAHTLGDLLTKLATTRTFGRFGYRDTMIASVIGFAAVVAACGLFSSATPLAVMAVLLFVGGCFRSFLGSGMGTLSYAEIRTEDMASATTFNLVLLYLVQAIGISLMVLVIDTATRMRGGSLVDAGDCRGALVAVAAVSLLALWPLSRLRPDAGAEISGHRARG